MPFIRKNKLEAVSVTVPDLHGIARGKKVPARRLHRRECRSFAAAVEGADVDSVTDWEVARYLEMV